MTSTTSAATSNSNAVNVSVCSNNSDDASSSSAVPSDEDSAPEYSIDSLDQRRRRKTSEADDAYNTLFTRRPKTSSVDLLNSTPIDSLDLSGFGSATEYVGGLLSPAALASSSQPPSISSRPSDSSYGFQNTYAVLERQLASKASAARQLREFLQYNDLNQTPLFCSSDVTTPLSLAARDYSANYLSSITEESESLSSRRTSSTTHPDDLDDLDAGPPSFLELELEASSRLRKLRERLGGSLLSIDGAAGEEKPTVESPMVEALYGISAESLAKAAADRVHPNPEVFLAAGSSAAEEDDKASQSGEYPEYIYHVAKGNDGRMYLKVVRSLLLDKVLCGNRVSQMTRAYDDIDAVTRLLEEKEKDLELTVQIGKELLTQNTHLENRVAELEQELKNTNENLSQLAHELHQKNELIGILTNDEGDSSENVTPTTSKSVNLELLQRKVKSLEEANKSLRSEAAQLVKETDECEEQERKLMADIANQLSTANSEYDGLNLELERLKEENRLQHEQIISLTGRLTEAEIRLHQLTTENEEASSLLSITKENQNLLAGELAEFKARYQEVLNLLHDTQEQLRRQRKRSQPMARSSLIPGLSVPAPDSLQSELMETSLYSEHSLDSGIASERGGPPHLPSYKKVFETVRSATRANTTGFSDGFSQLGSMTMSSSSQPRMAPYVFPGGGTTTTHSYKSGSSVYSTMYESSLGGRSFSRESLVSESEDGYPGPAQAGIPGAPGAKDLEAALKRLTPAEVLARRAMLQHAPAGTYSYDDQPSGIPLGCRTPDSIMSTGSSGLSGMSSTQWRLPEKLQIVKPIEGSQTLHHWSRLATPTLSGLLEERPGVTIRGGRGLEDLGLQTYSLSDVEEDAEEHPGKRFQTFGCTYTYTNSTVMHPDDGTTAVTFSLPPSQMSSQMASECPSRQPSAPSTPRTGLSRRNSCSTFSVNLGLASMLNERGIKAVTPSALNTPAGPNYSPTVTPCNSPEGSPTRSMSPEPPLLSGLLASGADILRKKFAVASSSSEMERPSRLTARNKLALSRLEKKALRSIKIMEKVESMGVDNFMSHSGHGISPLALHGSSALYTSTVRGRTSSPMAQLTSLKHLQDGRMKQPTHHHQQQHPHGQDGMFIDKETIKAVLSKGLSHDSLKNLSSGSSDASGSSSVASGAYADSDSGTSSISGAAVKPGREARKVAAPGTEHKSSTEGATPSAATAARLKQMQRQKSRRNLLNGANGSQRPDLGTVNGSSRSAGVRPDLGTVGGSNKSKSNSSKNETAASSAPVAPVPEQSRSLGQSVYGTISSLLFGRKGGLL